MVEDHIITQATFNPKLPTTQEEDNIKHIVYVKKMRLRDVMKHSQVLTNKSEQDFEPKFFLAQVPQSYIPRTIRDTDEHRVWTPKSNTKCERFALGKGLRKNPCQQMACFLIFSTWPWRQADNDLMWD